MYEAFYGLNERPFNLTPDPRFVFLSRKHKEAFAHLIYGIRERCGFIMVSGEIGTGKTTICRSLLSRLDSDTEVAFIFNPCLSAEELIREINEDFRIPTRATTVKGLVDELNLYLLEQTAKGKNCVIIIDEAQNLEPAVLEQIRLLSNLETETQKLLQIVLIGQPELAEKLETRELRQLNQRITARYHLEPLNFIETLHYIAFRLRTAGGRRKVRFTRSAVRKIYRLSKGTPRVINALCDRALLIGYTCEKHDITRSLIKRAHREVRGKAALRKRFQLNRLIPTVPQVITTGILLILVVLLTSGSGTSLDEVKRMAGSAWGWATAPSDPGVDATTKEPAPQPAAPAARNYPLLSSEEVSPVKSIAVARAVVPSWDDGARSVDLHEALRAIDAERLRNSGLTATLRAWNLAVLGDLPNDNSTNSLRRFASDNGLDFLEHTPDFNQLAAINLPVLIDVRKGDGTAQVGLLGLDGDEALVSMDDAQTRRVPRAQLEDAYTGRAFYMWADPTPDKEMIGYFRRGALVRELQDDLRALGLFSGISSGIYDDQTAGCVVQIQQASGLTGDAVVGAHTRMVINSWLGNSPSLSSTAFPDAVREGVLMEQARLPRLPVEPQIPAVLIGEPEEPPSVEAVDLLVESVDSLESAVSDELPPDTSLSEAGEGPVEAVAPSTPPSSGDPVEQVTEPTPVTDGPAEQSVEPKPNGELGESPAPAQTLKPSTYESVLRADAFEVKKDVTPPSSSQAPLRPRASRETTE